MSCKHRERYAVRDMTFFGPDGATETRPVAVSICVLCRKWFSLGRSADAWPDAVLIEVRAAQLVETLALGTVEQEGWDDDEISTFANTPAWHAGYLAHRIEEHRLEMAAALADEIGAGHGASHQTGSPDARGYLEPTVIAAAEIFDTAPVIETASEFPVAPPARVEADQAPLVDLTPTPESEIPESSDGEPTSPHQRLDTSDCEES